MESGILKVWKNYRHRFVPWIANNITTACKREVVSSTDKITTDDKLRDVIISINSSLNVALKKSSAVDTGGIMLKALGYSVQRAESCLKGGGTGVVLSSGSAQRGDFVAVYPGTIYRRFEPLFLPSLGNRFILRCMDGIHIDGNDKLLSKIVYRSCVKRDSYQEYKAADLSWVTKQPVVPWNIGQYVNNGTKEHPANVAYQELDIFDFPPALDYLMPNIWYSGSSERHLRTVVLVATRNIQPGDEILSNYVTIVHD